MKKERQLENLLLERMLEMSEVILIKNLVSEGNNYEMDSTNNNKYIQ